MASVRGISGTAAAFPTSETVGTSIVSPRVNEEFVDTSGNKYIIVDCQQAFVAGEWVYIDHEGLATRMTDSGVASRVGLIVAAVSASDTKAYAQIYGLYEGAAGTSNVAITKFLSVPAGTSDIGVVSGFASSDAAGVQIYGAYAVTAPDSGATSAYATSFVSAGSSATTYIGFKVWLNYPWTQGSGFIGQTS